MLLTLLVCTRVQVLQREDLRAVDRTRQEVFLQLLAVLVSPVGQVVPGDRAVLGALEVQVVLQVTIPLEIQDGEVVPLVVGLPVPLVGVAVVHRVVAHLLQVQGVGRVLPQQGILQQIGTSPGVFISCPKLSP